MPAAILVQPLVVAEGRASRNLELRGGDAYGHQTLDRPTSPRRAASIRRSGSYLRNRGDFRRLRGRVSGTRVQKGRDRAVENISRCAPGSAAGSAGAGKGVRIAAGK